MVWLLAACSPKPKPIQYGVDLCAFCHMSIVDRQHAAELVNTKGKAFKFDAIECMIQYANLHDSKDFALYLVNDYLAPGQLIDATASTYLISPNIPSPMGAFLSAFDRRENAEDIQAEQGGEVFDWEGIRERMRR